MVYNVHDNVLVCLSAVNLGALQLRALFEHWPSAKPMETETAPRQPQERERERERGKGEREKEREGETGEEANDVSASENGGCLRSVLVGEILDMGIATAIWLHYICLL